MVRKLQEALIVRGGFFQFHSNSDVSIICKCMICQKSVKGITSSNFLKHLRVNFHVIASIYSIRSLTTLFSSQHIRWNTRNMKFFERMALNWQNHCSFQLVSELMPIPRLLIQPKILFFPRKRRGYKCNRRWAQLS